MTAIGYRGLDRAASGAVTVLRTLSELVCCGEKSTPTVKKSYDGKAGWPILLSSTGGFEVTFLPVNEYGNSPSSATRTAENGDPR